MVEAAPKRHDFAKGAGGKVVDGKPTGPLQPLNAVELAGPEIVVRNTRGDLMGLACCEVDRDQTVRMGDVREEIGFPIGDPQQVWEEEEVSGAYVADIPVGDPVGRGRAHDQRVSLPFGGSVVVAHKEEMVVLALFFTGSGWSALEMLRSTGSAVTVVTNSSTLL